MGHQVQIGHIQVETLDQLHTSAQADIVVALCRKTRRDFHDTEDLKCREEIARDPKNVSFFGSCSNNRDDNWYKEEVVKLVDQTIPKTASDTLRWFYANHPGEVLTRRDWDMDDIKMAREFIAKAARLGEGIHSL